MSLDRVMIPVYIFDVGLFSDVTQPCGSLFSSGSCSVYSPDHQVKFVMPYLVAILVDMTMASQSPPKEPIKGVELCSDIVRCLLIGDMSHLLN